MAKLHHVRKYADILFSPVRKSPPRPKCWRIGLLASLSLLLAFGVLKALQGLSILAIKLHPRFDLSWYDIGLRGLSPVRHYHSYPHPIIDVEWLQRDARCSRDDIYIAPKGSAVDDGAVIMDHTGEPIWKQHGSDGSPHDFRMQVFEGQKYLTFWAGHERAGIKQGHWYMMNDRYEIEHKISPGHGFPYGDLHEFNITPNNTALVTVYEHIPFDLSPIGGPSDGWLLDSLFQELDIQTSQVLFEWRASDHFPINATRKEFDYCNNDPNKIFAGCGLYEDSGFDWFHMNSIEKDAKGNYLVSARNLFTVFYVNGQTGEVQWRLGGDLNDFEDISQGIPEGDTPWFEWQHYAHFIPPGGAGDDYDNDDSHDDEEKTVLLFDNHNHNHHDAGHPSRALRFDLDIARRTVNLGQAYDSSQGLGAYSQGSTDVLQNGNVFVSFGQHAAFSEYSYDGELLCDARFGPSMFFSFGAVSSYRTFRGRGWVGHPTYPPQAAVHDDKIYVSWNGATEVARWRVEASEPGSENEDLGFVVIKVNDKTGFETEIEMPVGFDSDRYASYRIVALDAEGDVLGKTETFAARFDASWRPMQILRLLGLGLVGAIMCVGGFYLRRRRGRRLGKGPTRSWSGFELLPRYSDVVVEENQEDSLLRENQQPYPEVVDGRGRGRWRPW